MKSGIMSNNKLTEYELLMIIEKYGLEIPNVTYDESSFKVCIFGKIGDDIFYEFDSRSCEVKLRGKIPESVANQFTGGCDYRDFFDKQFSREMVNIMRLSLNEMNKFNSIQKEKNRLDNRDILEHVKYVSKLTIHSSLELIKFIEAYSNLFRGDGLEKVAEKRNNEILADILLNKIKVGIPVEEWIKGYNETTAPIKGNGVRIYPAVEVPLDEKTYMIFVNMLKDSLSVFEKAVNPFIEAGEEDVLRLLASPDIEFTPIKIRLNESFKYNKYMGFGFVLKGLVKNELSLLSLKRSDGYKFSLSFQNSFFSIDYTNEGISFKYNFLEEDFDVYKNSEYGNEYNFLFSKIDEYDGGYIEEVIKLINEATVWANKLIRDSINGKKNGSKERLRTVGTSSNNNQE